MSDEIPKTRLAVEPGGAAGVLASFNAVGGATAYFNVQVWLEWSIARFGGACGPAAVEWCFDQLGVTRI